MTDSFPMGDDYSFDRQTPHDVDGVRMHGLHRSVVGHPAKKMMLSVTNRQLDASRGRTHEVSCFFGNML